MDSTGAGDVIREHRERARLTQDDVAVALGKTEGAVSQWETGRTHPRRATALRLDDLLNAGGAIAGVLGYVKPAATRGGPSLASVDRRVTELGQLVQELTARVDAQDAEIRKLRGRPAKSSGRASSG